ncbi:VWA domain-containing protein [Zavarzinella formosa]|uniref:VWA domain-containing protein n=1 Tax=Zavarzinella formosa TaxID=360055 RepID=UPI0003002E44|nr:VWA domain-containing protein [Zavarzinella formosa]
MTNLLAILGEHWLVTALAAVIVVALARLGLGRRVSPTWPVIAGLTLAGYFAWPFVTIEKTKPAEIAGWFCLGVVGLMALKLVNLLITGGWSRRLMRTLGGALVFGLGGFAGRLIQSWGVTGFRTLGTVDFVQPWWLTGLILIPLLVYLSFQSLAGLGPIRRWMALSIRSLLVAVLVVTLSEPRLRRPNENVCVIYVIDRSLSVPPELETIGSEGERDRRWLRIQQFINAATQQRGPGHRNDLSGAIMFARRPKLVLPPALVDRMIVTDAFAGTMDPNYTDIAAALKLAMASFPEGTGKRVVLISDGNENLGNAEDQAALAKQNGIQIDVIPLAEGYRLQNEVLIQSVEAPQQTTRGARLPVSVIVRNAHPSRVVFGKLELLQNRDGKDRPIALVGRGEKEESPYAVRLVPGLNRFVFRDKAEGKGEEELSYSYRAVFIPEGSANPDNTDHTAGLAGDRIQNNKALAHVIARGSRRVLFLEPDVLENGSFPHQHLIDQLRGAKFQVLPVPVARLPQNRDELTVFLSNYDCLIIGDIPADRFSKDQHEAIRANTYDQGCGLVFVGGPESYGAGGYHKTPIEAALPVDSEIKALKAAGRGGLVLIMHASELADGNKWQKEIAKLAIDRLNAVDMLGVLYYDGSTKWHVPFQEVGEDKARLKGMIDRMVPGDMPDFDPFLKAAADTLADPQHGLAVKHCILISDGDPPLGVPGRAALAKMKENKITCSTVGVATHSPAQDVVMGEIADGAAPGGKYYNVKNPEQLPEIYMRESRRVSQSYLFEKKFNPKLVSHSGPTDKLDPNLPDLYGFIRTTLKNSPLAEMLVEGPKTFDQRFPILATWQYGLGRSAAFTSDARTTPGNPKLGWDRDWAGSEIYLKFWEQVVGWAMRGLETDRMVLTTEYREGKVRVVVEARDENNKPITDLKLTGKVSAPIGGGEGVPPVELKFEQRAGGYYEAEFKADQAGSYIVNAQARQRTQAYKGRFRNGLPMTTVEKNGQLQLTDGTPVKKLPDGKLAYVDNGQPVEIEQEVERVVDSRRSGVTISYSPEFADLETNATLLKTLARLTGGTVHAEDAKTLKDLAASGDIYRPAPEIIRALLPLWYWLVFAACLLLIIDVANRRITVERHEVTELANRWWAKLRKRAMTKAKTGPEDEFISRLRNKKTATAEQLENEKASRKFEPESTTTAAPTGGADEMETKPPQPAFTPPPPPPKKPETKPDEGGTDYFSKLRAAKKRAPTDRDPESE